MPDNEGVIRFKGDATQLEAALKKVTGGMIQAGRHADTLADKIGKKVTHGLEHAVLRSLALVEVLKKAGEQYEKIREEKIEASKTVGESALTAQVAGARLGLSGSLATSLLEGEGTTSLSDRAGFLSKLSGKTKDREYAGRLGLGEVVKATGLFNSGLYSEDEIDDALKNGSLDELAAENRAAGLTGNAKLQYRTSVRERSTEQALAKNRARAGFGKRFTDTDLAYEQGFQSDLQRGFFGTVGAATSIVGGDKALAALDRIAGSNEAMVEFARRPLPSEPAE